MSPAPAGGQGEVLALDVVDDHRTRPGQQRRHDQPDTLAGPRRGEAQDVLGSVVAQIVPGEPAEDHAVLADQPGVADFARTRPARRAEGRDLARFAGAPHRHGDGDGDRDEPARRGDVGALIEDLRRVGVEPVPPPEEGRRWIYGKAQEPAPRRAEFGLERQPPRDPFRRAPGRGQHDRQHDEHLAPENARRGHRLVPSSDRLARIIGWGKPLSSSPQL